MSWGTIKREQARVSISLEPLGQGCCDVNPETELIQLAASAYCVNTTTESYEGTLNNLEEI